MTGISTYRAQDWRLFLQEWNDEFLRAIAGIKRHELLEVYANLKGPVESRWLGGQPASPAAVEDAQRRLAIGFPADYIDFLTVSNGWVAPGFESYEYMISPVEGVDFYSNQNAELLGVFREEPTLFFKSGDVEESTSTEFLSRTIGLCKQTRSIVLLFDPEATALKFWRADFHDRARVFATFTDLVLFERERCRTSFSEILDMFAPDG